MGRERLPAPGMCLAKALADVAPNGLDNVEGNILFNLACIDRFEIDRAPTRVHCHDAERSMEPDYPLLWP